MNEPSQNTSTLTTLMQWHPAKARAFKKIASKFEAEGNVTLQDINHVVRLAHIDPSRAVSLISNKQNSVALPSEPDAAARALSNIGVRYHEVAEQAFDALLQNPSKFSRDHICALIVVDVLEDPIRKIEASSYPFKIELLGYLAQKQARYHDGWKPGKHTEEAVRALCRIGGKEAEAQMMNVLDKMPDFSDLGSQTFPDIEKALRLRKIMAEAKFTPYSCLINDLKALDDGRLVDHLSEAVQYVIPEGVTEFIKELGELNSKEAANAIFNIGLDTPELKLAALDALGSMRHHAVQNGVNDLEAYNTPIKALLREVVDIEEIKLTDLYQVETYKLHFADAAKNGIIPETYAMVFTRAADLVEEQYAVEAAIADLDQSETGVKPQPL